MNDFDRPDADQFRFFPQTTPGNVLALGLTTVAGTVFTLGAGATLLPSIGVGLVVAGVYTLASRGYELIGDQLGNVWGDDDHDEDHDGEHDEDHDEDHDDVHPDGWHQDAGNGHPFFE